MYAIELKSGQYLGKNNLDLTIKVDSIDEAQTFETKEEAEAKAHIYNTTNCLGYTQGENVTLVNDYIFVGNITLDKKLQETIAEQIENVDDAVVIFNYIKDNREHLKFVLNSYK